MEILQVKLLGASPLASSQVLLRGPCPTPSPPSQRTSLFCSGDRGASSLYPGGEGCIELPRSPTVGRQKPRSCTPPPSCDPEGPACQFSVLCVPRAGRGWRKEPGVGEGLLVEEGGLGSYSQGPLPFPRPRPGIYHLHLRFVCRTLIKAPASPVSSPVSSLLPWEKDLGLETAQPWDR